MSDFEPYEDNDSGIALQDAKPKLKRPPLYKVILLNDDFTPMDFVIEILMDFFAMSEQKATQVMLQIHTQVWVFVEHIVKMWLRPRSI
jgi:ATP-dependent Clp protease adaptor protein ClpS